MLTGAEIMTAMQELAPAGVACSTWCDGEPRPLWPAEISAAAGMSDQRRHEFAAGRHCAREALARLQHEAVALPIGSGRAPVWPPGIIGSISHIDGIAIAAVARTSDLGALGIDVENGDPLEAELLTLVCREDELAELSVNNLQPGLGAKLIFSAKESVYKCLWPLTGVFLEFRDIGIRIDHAGHRFTAYGENPRIEESLQLICGGYRKVGGLLLSCAWLP